MAEDIFKEFQNAILCHQVEAARRHLFAHPEWSRATIEAPEGMVCPLYYAVKESFRSKNVSMVDLLMSHGADLYVCNEEYVTRTQTTPLAEAAKLGSKDCPLLDILLENDQVNNNIESRLSFTALFHAAKRGDLELVKRLVAMGFDVNWLCDDLNSAVHAAACSGDAEVMKFLLEEGAEINLNNTKTSPLHLAVRYNHIELVRLLINHGADVNEGNSSRFSPLMMACSCDLVDVVEVLLENGASVNNQRTASSPFHFSPLSIATFHSRPEIVSLLLKYGADVNLGNECAITPLHIATNATETADSIKIIEMMIQHGAKMDKLDSLGRTALICSLIKGREKMFAVLIKHGSHLGKKEFYSSLRLALLTHTVGTKTMDIILKACVRGNHQRLEVYKLRECLPEGSEVKYSWLVSRLTDAFSLQDLCRVKIRDLLIANSGGTNILPKISNLPLTEPTIKFLGFES